jgi:hypothetical protein
MDRIRLMVFLEEENWRIRVGDKLSRPYKSQNEAIRSAFDYAKTLAQEGLESEVVLKVLTYQFGPGGFFKAVPTPLRTLNDDA